MSEKGSLVSGCRQLSSVWAAPDGLAEHCCPFAESLRPHRHIFFGTAAWEGHKLRVAQLR